MTKVLLENIADARLYPVHHCYHPRHRALLLYIKSVVGLLGRILFARVGGVLLIIVGSPGDAIRAVPVIWCARARGLPTICQYHNSADNIFPRISRRVLKRLVVWALRAVDLHWFLSERLRRDFLGFVPDLKRTIVVPNALDRKWTGITAPPLSERSRDIVFFGRWAAEKGLGDLTAIMAELPSGAECEIYTSGAPDASFPNCTIHDWVGEEDVIAIMRSARLLVLPSYTEAFPAVIVEALACGTPFVASDVGGIGDIAVQSGGGLTFAPGDREGFTAGIERVLSDAETWHKMSKSGKTWSQGLDAETVSDRWREVFGSLVPDQ